MSLLNKASLIQIPSGYKDGTLYSAKPTNGDGDFTFSRGSNLAATRVNSEGLIEKGRENLLQQSNTFDTTWGANNVTLASGQSGYDGSSDAWLLTATGSTARIEQSVSANLNVFSIYAKEGTTDGISLRIIDGATNPFIFWNLNDGSYAGSTGGGGIDSNNQQVTDVGGGWYRIQITTASATTAMIYVSDSSANLVTSGNIYIQDAQLESGLVATDYIETTTTTAQAGILEDMPRLDYSGGATCGSLLLEGQRSNLLTKSEYIHGWLNAGGTSSQNSEDSISPEGLYNSAVLDASSIRFQTLSISSSAYSYSVYAKAKSGSILGLRIDTPTTKNTYFNLSDGTIQSTGSGHTASIEAVGNGWYRCIISFTDSIVNAVLQTTSSGSVYVWGAMLEEGSYPTSYIPTYGASVTRGDENSIITSATDIIGQTEGTMFYEFNSGKNDGADYAISLSDGSANNRIIIYRSSANQLIAQIRTGATSVAQINTSTLTEDITYKVALGYANNDVVFYVNGSLIGSDTSASIPSTDRISTDNSVGSATFGRPLNQLLLFKTRLSNDELATLTTI